MENFLQKYLNEEDFHTLQEKKQRERYNWRTGRRVIGGHHNNNIILRPGSKKNYISTLRKFGKYKLSHENGRETPITDELIERYNRYLNSQNLAYMTRLTHVRTLNKYLVGPLLGKEIPPPRATANVPRNNKPRFPHRIIADVIREVWNNNNNNIKREHAHKLQIIYYTGLRGRELDGLTYRTIFDATDLKNKSVILKIVNGKNGRERYIPLLEPHALHYYFNQFLPYIKMNYNLHHNDTVPIFKESYLNTLRAFKKALGTVLHDLPNLSEAIKGSGLHSIRSDYATRMLKYITDKLGGDLVQAGKILSGMMGHSIKILHEHYMNQGGGDSDGDDPIHPLLEEQEENNWTNEEDNNNWGRNIRQIVDRPFTDNNTTIRQLLTDNTTTDTRIFYV